MKAAPAPSSLPVTLALVAVQALFSVNYIASKILVTEFPPLVWGSLRLIASSALLMPIAFLARPKARPRGGAFFRPLAGHALLGVVINQAAFMVGLRYTTATNSSILNSLIPVFTLLLVTIRGIEPLTARRALGFAAALAGVLVLRDVERLTLSDLTWIGDLLMVLNCLSFALFLTYSRSFFQAHDPVWSAAWLFAYGSVGISAFAVPEYLRFRWPEMNGTLVACMAFGVLGSTLLAYLLNLWALARARSSSVALFIYLQPVFSSLLAWAFLNEPPTPRSAAAAGLIFLGMLLGMGRVKDRANPPDRRG